MKNLEKLWNFKTAISRPVKSLIKVMEFYLTNLCIRDIFNQVLNLCVYRIVLHIPAVYEFIMRVIPANIFWIPYNHIISRMQALYSVG